MSNVHIVRLSTEELEILMKVSLSVHDSMNHKINELQEEQEKLTQVAQAYYRTHKALLNSWTEQDGDAGLDNDDVDWSDAHLAGDAQYE